MRCEVRKARDIGRFLLDTGKTLLRAHKTCPTHLRCFHRDRDANESQSLRQTL
jgi:hypothetical protein